MKKRTEHRKTTFTRRNMPLLSAVWLRGIFIIVLFAPFVTGCNQPEMDESKDEVFVEWRDSRVTTLLSLAREKYGFVRQEHRECLVVTIGHCFCECPLSVRYLLLQLVIVRFLRVYGAGHQQKQECEYERF